MANRYATPVPTAIDGNGDPISGATLTFYASGTVNLANTYSDDALAIPNTNPVVADGDGRFPSIFLSFIDYKVVKKDSGGVILWTRDPVRGGAFESDYINVKNHGAVGDCTGVGLGTDDSSAWQAAIDVWKALPHAVLYVPEGRYRIAAALTADLAKNHGQSIIMDGAITPDATLDQVWFIHDGSDMTATLRVEEGGTLKDYSTSDPTDKTECFVLRGIRGLKAEIHGWGYLGRVCRVLRQSSGERKTSMNNIRMITGDVNSTPLTTAFGRCGQSIFADDAGVGDAQGGWGDFSGILFWDTHGPVFEDLNDLGVGTIHGAWLTSGVEIRGCIASDLGRIYSDLSGGDAISIIDSESGTARSCQRLTADVFRTTGSAVGVRIKSTTSTETGIVIDTIIGGGNTTADVWLEDTSYIKIGKIIAGNNPAKALHMTGTIRQFDIGVWGRSFSDDGVFIDTDVDRGILRGALLDGSAGKSLINYQGTTQVTLDNMTLSSTTVTQLINIASASANQLIHRGGEVIPSGGAIAYTSGRRPHVIRDVEGFTTEASGSATILSGNTSITVTHGLADTPVTGQISLTPAENATNDPGTLWVDTITSTQFNINCRADPGASNLSVGWAANVTR